MTLRGHITKNRTTRKCYQWGRFGPYRKRIGEWWKGHISDITDGRVSCPVNVVVNPRVSEHQNRGIRIQAGELFPEGLEVIPKEMAEEASTGDLADNLPKNIEEVFTKTTAMNSTTKDDVIVRPAPRQVLLEVLEETRTDDTTIEECTYGILDTNETTKRKVSTKLLDISQQLITRGFLEWKTLRLFL